MSESKYGELFGLLLSKCLQLSSILKGVGCAVGISVDLVVGSSIGVVVGLGLGFAAEAYFSLLIATITERVSYV